MISPYGSGDAYLIVAGCPIKTSTHALKICDMAFDMMDGIQVMKDPYDGQDNIRMRIGCHSGSVVAGIVGLKMPRQISDSYLLLLLLPKSEQTQFFRRYCLFGLNVALTEKFESNSKPMRIHISQDCKDMLPQQYKTEERTDEPGLSEKVNDLTRQPESVEIICLKQTRLT